MDVTNLSGDLLLSLNPVLASGLNHSVLGGQVKRHKVEHLGKKSKNWWQFLRPGNRQRREAAAIENISPILHYENSR